MIKADDFIHLIILNGNWSIIQYKT